VGTGRREDAINFGKTESEIFLQGGLDDPNQLESVHEISFYAHVILVGLWGLRVPPQREK
jgi:hypothetical protein